MKVMYKDRLCFMSFCRSSRYECITTTLSIKCNNNLFIILSLKLKIHLFYISASSNLHEQLYTIVHSYNAGEIIPATLGGR